MAHEYIHVLQYEGRGADFVKSYLGNEIVSQVMNMAIGVIANVGVWPPDLRAAIKDVQLPSAASAEEAVPYLWQAFIGTIDPKVFSYELPWNIWLPGPHVDF